MMKHNIIALHTVVRNVRQFSAFGVKTLVHQRPSHSAYQQFDVPSRQQQITNKLSLSRIIRKLLGQFSPSVKMFSTSVAAAPVAKCWNCSVAQETYSPKQMFCQKCGLIRDIGDGAQDYFQMLGVERHFAIDTMALTQNFRQLQSVIHPDKFSNKSDKEQRLSADWSSLINKAYKTLSAPIKRGEYILKLHGIEIPEGNTAVGSDFLLEMMERNEEVDDAQKPAELQELLQKVREDLERVVSTLDASLKVKNLDTALQNVITLRYLISLENSIKNKKTRMGILT